VAYHDADATNNGSGVLNPANGAYLNQFQMKEGVGRMDIFDAMAMAVVFRMKRAKLTV
jgi:hypothetical protein